MIKSALSLEIAGMWREMDVSVFQKRDRMNMVSLHAIIYYLRKGRFVSNVCFDRNFYALPGHGAKRRLPEAPFSAVKDFRNKK